MRITKHAEAAPQWAAFVLRFMALDEQAKALGIDPARSSFIAFFSETVAFYDAFLNALIQPRAAYAKALAGIADAEILNWDGGKGIGVL